MRTAVAVPMILHFVIGLWSFDILRFSDKQTSTELSCAPAAAKG
jgi:hypothetical protein